MHRFRRTFAARVLALALAVVTVSAGCDWSALPAPLPGLSELYAAGFVEVPGGLYSVATANLVVRRRGLSVDTKVLRDLRIAATYNSATRAWHWSPEIAYDGQEFVDLFGGRHAVGSLADGAAIPGTDWHREDGTTLRTRGGLVHAFDATGRLAAVYWRSDPYPRLRYDWTAARLEIRECVHAALPLSSCRLVFGVDLGVDGPTRVVDEESARAGSMREAHYDYDGEGRLETARTAFEIDAGLPGTHYAYADGLVVEQTNSHGERITYAWVAERLWKARRIGEGDPEHTFAHVVEPGSPPAYAVVHVNPLGGNTRYAFGADRRITRIERLDSGELATIEWDAVAGRPSRVVDFDGAALELLAWVDDEPTRIVLPSGNVIDVIHAPDAVSFDAPRARPTSLVTDALGVLSATDHDASGRPIRRTNGAGESVELAYQGGEVAERRLPWGDVFTPASRGVHGRWRSGALASLPDVLIKRKFDRVGNPLVPAAGLQRGGVLEVAFDGDRRVDAIEVVGASLAGVELPAEAVGIERRSDGQPLRIARPRGADHEIDYDALGRRERVCARVAGVCDETWLHWNAADLPTAIERSNGMREELDYDVYGRPIAQRLLRDGVLAGARTWTWSAGRLVAESDSIRGATRTLHYDGAARLVAEAFSVAGETRTLEYDLRSRVIREVYQLGGAMLALDSSYDGADRRVRLSRDDGSAEGELLRETVIVAGRAEAERFGNGLTRETRFDAVTGRVAGYRTHDGMGATVAETAIARTAESDPQRLQVVTETTSPLAVTREEYWLDLPGSLLDPNGQVGMRLLRSQGWEDGVAVRDDTHRWDALSNPVDDADGDAFVYDASRTRLESARTSGIDHTYVYDVSGFAVERDGVELAWSAGGRLARVGPAAAPLAELLWDVAGRLVSLSAGGETREFAYFGGRVERDAVTGAPGWLHLGDVSLPFTGTPRRFRHPDFRGNTSLVTDETGAVVSHRRYDAFGLGSVAGTSGSGPSGGLESLVLTGFAGGIALLGQGLAVLGARVLDSDVGRFLSPDPIRHDLNQYTYALGNPIGFGDPSGLAEVAFDFEMAQARNDVVVNGLTFVGATGGAFVAASALGKALAAGTLAAIVVTGSAAAAGAIAVVVTSLGLAGAVMRFAQIQIERSAAPDPVAPAPPPSGPGRTKSLTLEGRPGLADPLEFRLPEFLPGPVSPGCAPLARTSESGSGRLAWLVLTFGGLFAGRRRVIVSAIRRAS